MRFGCCLNMVATQSDGTGQEWLEALAQSGFDYVEMPTAQMMELDEEQFAALRERIQRTGLSCETSNNFFPTWFRLTGPQAELTPVMDYARRALARAEALGVEHLVFGSGPAKQVPEGFPLEEGYCQVVKLLQQLAPLAGDHGVTIVIEPLRRAECNLINTFAEGVQLARDVNDAHVRVLVDFYHLTEEAEPVQHLLDSGREFLHHVHFANPCGRVFPVRGDEADYRPFIDALKAVGYDGRVSCEAYAPNGFVHDAPIARRFFETQF